jgi:hypothetical protein
VADMIPHQVSVPRGQAHTRSGDSLTTSVSVRFVVAIDGIGTPGGDRVATPARRPRPAQSAPAARYNSASLSYPGQPSSCTFATRPGTSVKIRQPVVPRPAVELHRHQGLAEDHVVAGDRVQLGDRVLARPVGERTERPPLADAADLRRCRKRPPRHLRLCPQTIDDQAAATPAPQALRAVTQTAVEEVRIKNAALSRMALRERSW